MVFNGSILLACIIIVWLVILTILLYRTIVHYNRLTHGIHTKTLREILEDLLTNQDRTKRQNLEIERAIHLLQQETSFHLQRIGIVRYNPFSDTGGAQSFSLALIDGHSNGIVVTSLYARSGNRWFVKEIRGGKGEQTELSKEEQTAIHRAEQRGVKHSYE